MLSRILSNYLEAMKSYHAKPEELKKIQDKKVRFLVRYVYDSIPLYHDAIKRAGKSPLDFRGAEDLRWFQLLDRKTILENFPTRITNPEVKVGWIASTSGTTGRPLSIHLSASNCDLQVALRMRKFHVMGVSFFDRAAWVPYFGPTSDPGNGTEKDTKGNSLWVKLNKVLFGTTKRTIPVLRQATIGLGPNNLREVALALYNLGPSVVHTRPSYARRISEVLAEEGLTLHSEKLNVTGEYLSSGCRKDLERFYEAEIFDSYGSSELGGFGFECSEHSGIHLSSDFFIFEFIRADGQEVSGKGERGEIIISALDNTAMPLIRYRQGDNVILEEEGRCNCGSYLPRLRIVEGRPGDGLLSREGVRIPPGTIIDHFESSLGLRDFQIIQQSEKKLLVKLKGQSISKDTVEQASHYLKQRLGPDIDLEITHFEKEIPVKYRAVICEVKK